MVSTFTSNRRAIFFVLFLMISFTVYVTRFLGYRINFQNMEKDAVQTMQKHFKDYWTSISFTTLKNATEEGEKDASVLQDVYNVNYTDKLQDVKFPTLTNEKSNNERIKIRNLKKNAVQNMRKRFKEYWKSISSIILKNPTEEGKKDALALQDGFKVLDIRYEEIGNFFDDKIEVNNVYFNGTLTEFYIISNLLSDLKYYWLHISSVIKRLGLSSDMQEFVNNGYIKSKKELKNLIEESETIARKNMYDLQMYVQKRINELQNPNNCNGTSVYVCNMVNGAGFGSELHSILKCFLPAFKQQRTLIYYIKGWKYDPEGLKNLFAPLSDCDETQYTSLSNSQIVNGNAVYPTGYDFISIPEEISQFIIRNHADPFAWWIAQFIGYAMRIRPYIVNQLNITAQKINFTKPIAGVHIRRGDKIKWEAKKHEVEEYMFFIKNWFDEQNIEQRTVYVATDDDGVHQELKTKYPSYKFITTPTDTMQKGLSALQGIVKDIYLLSQCDFVACTGSSNICHLVYELFSFHHHDASTRWQSIDHMYYLNDAIFPYVAISDHSARKDRSEINFRKGDIIEVTHGCPTDGFINSENTNSREKGRVPLYKLRSKPSIDSFPILHRSS
ncbi:alpha-(1,6)-fucosyltransferase-like isoform X1 [Styela clava]